ncbi:MAG: NAD(P)/FAD-dependent oxidoreductase [Beutenbergiaceae bacterium]
MSTQSSNGAPARVVVAGGGLAGLRTLSELRGQGYHGELIWLGSEGVPAYDRPPLSKELLARIDPLWLADDLSIDHTALADVVALDRPATGLELQGGAVVAVETADGPIPADAVVIATGSTPRRPWSEARSLHNLTDARLLRESIRPGRHIAIIGAGWIGAEVAGVVAAAGCRVTVLEAGPTPLGQQLGKPAGERIRSWFASAGVELITDAEVADVQPDRVRFPNGKTIEADLVLAAVGVQPQTQWLRGIVPLLPNGQLATGRGGATEVPGIWAVGDVAMRETVHFGPVPGGHWFSALRDPALLAAQLLGRPLPASEPAPEVFSDQLGHHVEMIGRLVSDDEPGAAQVLREDADGGWTQLQIVGEYLVGAIVVDRPADVSAARKLLRGASLLRIDLDAAGDPTTPLRTVVAQ